MTFPTITLINHGDHLADSFAGDVRVVRRGRSWAIAVRGDGSTWNYSGTGPKRAIVTLANLAIKHKYLAVQS